MSSFDKTVKLACKPKAAVPKAKYLDPIIAATWSDDGAVHDVCKALVSRFREPNVIVVFKALIVLHTMMRNGSTDNVLSYLSSSNILRLRNISSANWEGYAAPQNLQNYALYLESRIVAYKELKHDAIKVQSESNRDMRNSQSVEEGGTITHRGRKDRRPTETSAPTRSKTIMGRKLRSMTVEKGLLRETKVVHRMINALVECRFYLDDLEDELTITALRMLVKDLLILFQAGNEGVINVLENYFEMSHVDAKEALRLYRHFCTQTENVVEFLGVARKLQNLLNVSIPNLNHAPVSLAGALQEYLDDPNFEQNRREYKANKSQSTRSKGAKPSSSQSNTDGKPFLTPSKRPASNGESSTATLSRTLDGKEALDFFAAIEEEQPTIFNPQTNSPNSSYFQQQASINPFSQMLIAQASAQPQQLMITAQPTGFLLPQATAVPSQPNPFGNFLTPQLAQPTGHAPFSTFIPQQPTSLPQQTQPMNALQVPQPFLQPQMTGANPFRQSMLIPQTTGMQLFGVANQAPVPVPSLPQSYTTMNLGQTSNGSSAPASAVTYTAPKPSFGSSSPPITNVPARPSSTPLTSSATTPSTLQPVKTHQTGTKNPFGPVSVPPVPKPLTLSELSTVMKPQISPQSSQPQQPQPDPPALKGFNFDNSSLNPGGADISSVASSFAFASSKPQMTTMPPTVQNNDGTKSMTSSTTGSDSLFSSPLSTQPTGLTSMSFLSSIQSTPATSLLTSTSPTSPVQSRLQGLKPFKPTSSFGAALFESLPPIAGSGPVTPAITGLPPSANAPPSSGTANTLSSSIGLFGSTSPSLPQSNTSFVGSQPTGATGGFGTSSFGSTLGVGLRPQMTGGGAANPFRASMAGGMPNFGASVAQPVPPLPIGLAGLQAFGGVGGMSMGLGASQLRPQTQQQANGSLI